MSTQPADDAQVLVTVARMYYEDGLSQGEIAARLGKSRPTVSRMLATARRERIVTIEIRSPMERAEPLEKQLREQFGLRDVRVVAAPPGDHMATDHLGRGAATYLHMMLGDGMTVGVSNGRALASTAKYLQPTAAFSIEFVQILGTLGNDHQMLDGPDIARAFAMAYDSHCRFMHVPLLVESSEVRATLLRSRDISQTLKKAAKADVVVTGVGTLDPSNISPIYEGFLAPGQIDLIRQAGAVGHIAGEFYTAAGVRAELDIHDRIVSLGLESLKRVPMVIAVAGGSTKAAALVAGIRGGLFNTLITDDRAAQQMLRLVTQRR